MSSGGARRNNQNTPQDEDYAHLQSTTKKSSGFALYMKTLPIALASSLLCVLLYCTVGGILIPQHLPYIAIAYGIGVFGLTVAYSNVSIWSKQQKSASKSSGYWFSIFYNNAFYVFLLILNSSIVFSSFKPTTSMILAQIVSVALPAWLSGMSVHKRKN